MEKTVTLLANVPLVVEYEATCSAKEHRVAAGLDEADVKIFLDAVAAMVEPVVTHFLWRPKLRDPSDEMVLEAAVNADAIVTFNATAVAEKLTAMSTVQFFEERRERADFQAFRRLMRRKRGQSPRSGDELR